MNKPKFDPTKPFQAVESAKPKFDPNAPFEAVDQAPVALEQPKLADSEASDLADISQAESFIRSGVQIPTLGFADEALGGLHAALDVASGSSPSEFEKLYTTYRDMERRKNELAAKANPKTSMAGSLAGGVATAFIPGLNVASVPGAVGLGALGGLGSSEADLTKGEVGKAAKDTIIGGVLGGTVQKAANAIGGGIKGAVSSIKKAGKEATEEAAQMGYKALGAGQKELSELIESRIRDQASDLPGIVEKYIRPVGGPEESWKAIQGRINEIEGLKAPLFKQGAEALQTLSNDQIQRVSNNSLTDKFILLSKKLASEQANLQGMDQAGAEALEGKIKKMLSNYLNPMEVVDGKYVQMPKDVNNLMDLNLMKKEFGKALGSRGFDQAEKIAEGLMTPENKALLQAKREAYDLVRDHITELGDTIGGDLGTQIKNLNKEESLLIDLASLTKKATGKEAASSGGGAGTGAAMNMGAAVLGGGLGLLGGGGNPVTGMMGAAAGLGAKTLLEKQLGQGVERALTAKSAQVLGNVGKKLTNVAGKLETVEPALTKAGQFVQNQADEGLVSGISQRSPFKTKEDTSNLATYNDEQLSGVSSALLNNPDEKLRSYGESLQKALQAGNIQGKNAAIFLIMQNPKARKQLGLTTRTFK